MTLLESSPAIEPLPFAPKPRPREPDVPNHQNSDGSPCWQRRLLRLSTLIAALLGIGVFGVTPDGTGLLQAIDSRVSAAFHIAGWRSTQPSTAITSPLIVAVAALVAVALAWEPGQPHRRRWNPLTVTVGAALTATLIGVVIGRPAPAVSVT